VKNMGKKLYVGLLVLSLAILMSTSGEAVCPDPIDLTTDEPLLREYIVCFLKASDTFDFDVCATPKGTRLTRGRLMIDTRDTALAGDRWGLEVTEPAFPTVIVLPLEQSLGGERVCGNGSTTEFSGAVTVLQPGGVEMATVQLSQCSDSGVRIFPAEANIRFQYTGAEISNPLDPCPPEE
jgi:hypothetical protein